jgi:hypothetical protein
MNVQDLQTRLRAGIGPDGVLPLTRAAFPEVAPVLEPLHLQKLMIADARVSGADGLIAVEGNAAVLGTPRAEVRLTVDGTEVGEPRLEVQLPEHWTFHDAFADLPPSLRRHPVHRSAATLQPSLLYEFTFAQPRLEIRPRDGTNGGVTFSGRTALPAEYAKLAKTLAIPADAEARATLTLAAGAAPQVEMELLGGRPALKLGGLALSEVGVRVATRDAAGDEEARTVLECDGYLAIGTTDPVRIRIASDYLVDNRVFRFEADAAPGEVTLSRGIHALMELAGGEVSEFSLPDGLAILDTLSLRRVFTEVDLRRQQVRYLGLEIGSDAPWTITEEFHVRDLRFGWMLLYPFQRGRTLSASVTGTLDLGSKPPVRFDVSAAKSQHFRIEGALREGDRIDLSALVESALGIRGDLPAIAVDALEIEATTAGDFRLDGSLSGDWHVEVGHERFTLERVTFALHREGTNRDAFVSAQVNVAGSRLFVEATVSSDSSAGTGVLFEGGTLPGGEPIHLAAVVSWALDFFGATLPANVPDVTLKNLGIRFNTATKEFHFEGETEVPIEVPFLAGENNRSHAAVNLTSTVDPATGHRSLAGYMEADVSIGGSVFTVRYALGAGSHVFTASWEGTGGAHLGLNTLLDAIGASHDVHIPDAVDLNLKRVYFEYQAELHTLTLVADSATYGKAFLVAGKPLAPDGTPGSWRFAFGLEYPGTSRLSEVPGLGGHMGTADMFHFEELGIVIASGDFGKFTLPVLPPLRDASGTPVGEPRTPVAAGATIPLREGISFVGVIDLGRSHPGDDPDGSHPRDDPDGSHPGDDLAALRTILPASKLTITAGWEAGAENFSLRAALDGSIDIPTGGTSDLRIGSPVLELDFPNPIAFKVKGDLALTFDHHTIDVRPQLTVSAEGAEFNVAVEFEDGWHAPMGIEGLTLDEVDFELGVNFLPAPGVNLGLQGSAHVGDEAPKSDEFAFVLEVIEEVPDPLLLSFRVAEISVEEALRLFAPHAPVGDLPDFVKRIRVTDVGFYWAESVVVMPDGTVAQPGLRFRGNVEILSFQAHAALSIDPSGIAGELMLAPIHVAHVADVTGDGEGVYRYERDGKPLPQRVIPEKNPAPAQRVQLVAPGGPVVQFRTAHSPWLHASLRVTLFGAVSEEIEALVSDQGVHFKLAYAVTDAVMAELDCTLDRGGLKAHAAFGLHLKADLGPVKVAGIDFGTIHLDAGFDLEMTLEASAERFLLACSGDFEFEGARLTFPTLRIDVAPASLAELPERLVRHLAENLEEVFAELFHEAERLVEAAAKEVARLAEEAAAEAERLAKAAIEEAERIEKEAERAIEQAAAEVAREAERIEKEAERIAQEAVKEVEAVARAAEQEVERVAGEIAKVAETAAHEVEAIGREIAREAEEVEHAVEKVAAEALHEAEQIAHAVEAEAQQILAEAQRAAQQVIDAAKAVVNALAREAEALWNEAKHLAEQAAELARNAAEAVENAAKSAWNTIKKY